jgi:hypothetical protein
VDQLHSQAVGVVSPTSLRQPESQTGYGAVFSTPTVDVVKHRNSGYAFAGIDNPLF